MSETGSNIVTLKKAEEERLQFIYEEYCNSDGSMKLNNFLMLVLDKNIVNNSIPIFEFATAFYKASLGDDEIYVQKFYYLIRLLASMIYGNHTSPIDTMFSDLLKDPATDSNWAQNILKEKANTPRFEEETSELLQMPCIEIFKRCHANIKNLFVLYCKENVIAKSCVVDWATIEKRNLGVRARDFLRFCRISNLIPHLFNVENLQEAMIASLPPKNIFEKQFYDRNVLTETYENERNYAAMDFLEYIEGEPILKLHEFCLLLGVIAIGYVPKSHGIEQKVSILFQDKLLLHSSRHGPGTTLQYRDQLAEDEPVKPTDQILKEHEKKRITVDPKVIDLSQLIKDMPVVPTLEDILEIFDQENIPQLPDLPHVLRERPQTAAGVQMVDYPLPKPPSPKNRMRQVMSSNRVGGGNSFRPNKDKEEDKPKFAPIPGSFLQKLPDKARQDNIFQLKNHLSEATFKTTHKQSFCNPGVQPQIIREIYLPPEAPEDVTNLIESTMVYQNQKKFILAHKCQDEAKAKWASMAKEFEPKIDLDLFFELNYAAIYESCGRDELALAQYVKAKEVNDRLPYNSPDRALLYCGLGSVLHHLGEAELSARSFLMAKKIRERNIGLDTVDTATVYNNVGVTYYHLGRHQECFAYFELASTILDELLGSHHPRTTTAMRNKTKCQRLAYLPKPAFKPLWRKQVIDPYPDKKGKKKKKKGGKKKKR